MYLLNFFYFTQLFLKLVSYYHDEAAQRIVQQDRGYRIALLAGGLIVFTSAPLSVSTLAIVVKEALVYRCVP